MKNEVGGIKSERCFACGRKKEVTHKLLWRTLDNVFVMNVWNILKNIIRMLW